MVLEDKIAALLSYPRPMKSESLRMGLKHQDVLETSKVILLHHWAAQLSIMEQEVINSTKAWAFSTGSSTF